MAVYNKAHTRIINNGAVDDAAASSLTHKQCKTNNNNGHHIHHIHNTSTQHHCRKQLLAGWERVLRQNERTATPPRRGSNEKRPEGRHLMSLGPLVILFPSHFIILLLTKSFIQVLSMLQQHYKPEAAKGRPTTMQRRGDEERRKGKKAQGTSTMSLGP